MRKEEIRITVYNYSKPEELPEGAARLITQAQKATKNAWSPYSGYSVGAALELTNGEIICGTNQENIAFPSGICAERVALFYANSKYPGMAIKRMALAAFTNNQFVEKPVFPCGNCRQALLEHENRVKSPVEVIMYGNSAIKVIKQISDLLPLPFDYEFGN